VNFYTSVFVKALFLLLLLPNLPAFSQESQQPVIAVKNVQYGRHGELKKTVPDSFDETGLMAALERALGDTKKFRVATRDIDKLKALREEQAFSSSGASAGNAAHEGELLASDYVVIPTLINFKFGRQHKDMPNLKGKYFRTDYGRLEVQTEVLDSSSGQSVGSYLLEDSFSTKEAIVNGKGGAPDKSHFLDMANTVGQHFADHLISAVFPMKVIGISNGQIYINRGAEGGLAKGDVLDVFRVGDALVDPDTGQSLGVIEDRLGKLKIVELKPKVAIAEPVSLTGEVAKLSPDRQSKRRYSSVQLINHRCEPLMMSSFSRFFMVTTIGLMSVLLNWSSAAEEGKRFALLIGNEAYTALPPLKNPLSDIRGLASSLNALGFHVTAHENIGNGADMLQMIEIFAEKARAAGAESVLFHYAGHGFEIDGENYLIPTVIEPPREEEIGEQVNREMQTKPLGEDQRLDRLGELRLSHISAQAIKLNDVMAKIKQAAPTRIVMLDACRDRPSLRSVTPSENLLQLPRSGFAITEGDAGTMIVYSTQPEATADDGSGPVSPFMGAMLKHIDELGLDVNELMTRVRKDVYDYTQGRQVPWAHSALLEPFSFRPAPEGYFPENKLLVEDDPETKSKQLAELQEADNSHWQQVENSLNIGAYQGYLQNFPDGLHADEAMQLLAKLGAHYDSEITIADAAMVPGVNDDQRKARAVDQTRKRIVVLGDTDLLDYPMHLSTGLLPTLHKAPGLKCWNVSNCVA